MNLKKDLQLEMPLGTASNRLRKKIMFHLLKKLNENFCYQCSAEIISEEELSIEHKIPWLDSDTPIESFFDLNNISFSHLSCNSAASRKRKLKHPSRKSYLKGCRCEDCKKENSIYKKNYKLGIL